MDKENLSKLVIRLAPGIVFLVFGIGKFVNPVYWLSYIPQSISNLIPFDQSTFIYTLGVIEAIIGILLIIGLFIKFISIVSSIHLVLVISSLGFNEISARDFALLLISISLILTNPSKYSLDSYLKRSKDKNIT